MTANIIPLYPNKTYTNGSVTKEQVLGQLVKHMDYALAYIAEKEKTSVDKLWYAGYRFAMDDVKNIIQLTLQQE